ncbi:MAG: glycoside hydrolase family 88 protein [Clostridia bacterium]|nr:glycoside hydrolase family 88 protein [Clostridia bacterium]
MNLLKIAEKIAYRYMALNEEKPLLWRTFYSGGVRRGRDYRYEADMNKIFPSAKTGDHARLKCVYISDSEGSIGMSISLLGATVLFVNGERLFSSDIFTERNNHIPNRLDIPVKKGINEIELQFKKTALGFGCIFGTHLAKWDYIFMRPDDYNQEGCIYCLNDGEWLPGLYKWQDNLTEEEKSGLLADEKMRKLPEDDMWLRPYHPKGSFGNWNYPLGVVMYGLMRTASLLSDKKIEEYTKRHIQRTIDTFDYAMWDKNVHGGATSLHNLLTSIDSLDDCGAFCAAVEEAMLLYSLDGRKICDFVADYIENRQPRNPDGSFSRQNQLHSFHNETMWLDDMYMSVPFLVRRYKITGEEKYLEDAVNQFVQYKKWLYMKDRNLMSHVYDLRHDIPTCVPWGRGNGWFIFSLTELLAVLPKEHPKRGFLEDFFITLSKGYLAHQTSDGRWRQVIDDDEAYLETSCTAMFAAAFMRGCRMGLLGEEYRISASRAVESIVKNCVDEEGNLYGVCRGSEFSFSNDYYKYDLLPRDNDTHGIGIVLLSIYEALT